MENTNLKPLTKSIYKYQIVEHFNYSTDFEFLDLVANVLNRIEFDCSDEEFDDEIWSVIDDELIYYKDQWTVIQHYQLPKDANFGEAMDEFSSDIYSLAYKIRKGDQE